MSEKGEDQLNKDSEDRKGASEISRLARIRAIQDLIQTGGYQVPPLLVAERMLERLTAATTHTTD